MEHGIVFRGINLNDSAHCTRYNVAELARSCGVSTKVLRRHLKRSAGCTPKRWMSKVFAERAETLLLQGVSVSQVAAEMGFSDLAHFSRTFRMARGFPPSQLHLKVVHLPA